jgi:hypothetical protein
MVKVKEAVKRCVPPRHVHAVRRIVAPARALLNCTRNVWTLLLRYGFLRSAATWSSVDRSGSPLPWYTYPAIDYLKQLDLSDKLVFEYGMGNSTLFWAERAKQVVSVEDDAAWLRRVSPRLPANALPVLAETMEAYVGAIDARDHGFDVIVIDGKHRLQCAGHVPAALNPGGLVILDNADSYPDCCEALRTADLLQVDLSGFGPIDGYTWTTTLFFHREFDFPHLGAGRPTPPMGSRSFAGRRATRR